MHGGGVHDWTILRHFREMEHRGDRESSESPRRRNHGARRKGAGLAALVFLAGRPIGETRTEPCYYGIGSGPCAAPQNVYLRLILSGARPFNPSAQDLLIICCGLFVLLHWDEGGRALGRIASLIGTAKINGIEPFAYLKATLKAIANGHPQSRIDDLLTRNFKLSS